MEGLIKTDSIVLEKLRNKMILTRKESMELFETLKYYFTYNPITQQEKALEKDENKFNESMEEKFHIGVQPSFRSVL